MEEVDVTDEGVADLEESWPRVLPRFGGAGPLLDADPDVVAAAAAAAFRAI